jgi:hypothetical protein
VASAGAEHAARLRRFNEKADELLDSSFKKEMFGKQTGLKLSWAADTGQVATTITGPNHEAIKAFVLTFRLFIQDGDGLSLRRLTEIYDAPGTESELQQEFHQIHDAANARLDETPSLAFNINGEALTRRRILEVFLYGGLAHLNPDKVPVYESWRSQPMFFALLQNEFMATMAEIFNCVLWVQDLNARLLDVTPVAAEG